MSGNYFPIGSPGLANTTTQNSESRPITVALPDGGYVIAWVSDAQDGSGKGLFGQRFDAFGMKIGSEFQLNTTSAANQQTLSLQETATGFVAVWESQGQDGSGYGIVMQRFGTTGNAVGPELVVNQTTAYSQYGASINTLSNGNIVVTWQTWSDAADDDVVMARMMSANGTPLGGEFQVGVGIDIFYEQFGPYSSAERTFPTSQVVALADGAFAVIWRDYTTAPGAQFSKQWLVMQRFDANGTANGAPAFIQEITGSNTFQRPVTRYADLAGGGVAILTCEDTPDLYLTIVDAAGIASQVALPLLSYSTDLPSGYGIAHPDIVKSSNLAVRQLADGSLMISFQAVTRVDIYDGIGDYVRTDEYVSMRGQQFDLTGAALNPAFFLTPEVLTEDFPRNLDMAALTGGGYALAWDLYEADGINSRGVLGVAVLGIDTGTTGDDSMVGTAGTDWLDGLSGNDTISGLAGQDLLEGNLGDDSVLGGIGNDVIYGGDGNDIVFGGSGNDQIDAGVGNDKLRNEAGDDVLRGGDGVDTLVVAEIIDVRVDLAILVAQATGQGNDVISGIEHLHTAAGNDSLSGNGFGNLFTAGAGNDTLTGAAGNDTLLGGAGNDSLDGGLNDDRLDGGDGFDWAVFNATGAVSVNLASGVAQATGLGMDTLLRIEAVRSGSGADALTGSVAANQLSSGAGNDTVKGADGADTLLAGSGNDVLIGGRGADALNGGTDTQRDTFAFWDVSHSNATDGIDTIYGFVSGTDVIDLHLIDANLAEALNQKFAFGGATASAFSVWVVQTGSMLVINADVTGDAVADFEVRLAGVSGVTAADFIL